MKIYVGFSSPRKFKIGAEVIKICTNSPYSHAYVRFESSTIQSSVYHAAHGMVHFRSQENFLKENLAIKEYEIEISNEGRIEILRHCVNIAGEKYSIGQLIQIAFIDLMSHLNVKIKPKDLSGYICSELVGKIMENKLGFSFDRPTFLLKPKDIDKALEKANVTVVQQPTQTKQQ